MPRREALREPSSMPDRVSDRSRFVKLYSLLCAALCLVSCSLGAAYEGKEPPEAPYAVFTDYVHTVVVRGAKNFELRAKKAELYETSKIAVLSGVSFAEYDPATGELVSSGSADSAVYHTDTKDAEFSGSVKVESKRQDASLAGERLVWKDKEKKLVGGLDRTVSIGRSDGSWVSGAGFEADVRRRSFSFRESVTGTLAGGTEQKDSEPSGREKPE